MSVKRDVTFSVEPWEFKSPFRITGYTFATAQLLHVVIRQNGAAGSGEAAGIYYLGETGESMLAQVAAVKSALEQGTGRSELRSLLPPGGARNAIDCALWDLQAKLEHKSIWELTGIQPGQVQSVHTIGLGTPEEMARTARTLDTSIIKVKLDAEMPVERIAAVRAARPDAEIVVDVNQGWTFPQLVELAPKFRDLRVAMIEQPLPRGADEALEKYRSPVPLCADESCLNINEFEQAARRYQMINIKLDKAGGLTEALELAGLALSRGIGLMVGNMMGTSLAMAPGFVLAQLCQYVDLDGALFLKADREHPMSYTGGVVSPPSTELWG
ncbi:MAG TPA: N-acetyl-D-Glu racemase DgcA [Woeseiaceae bacterium]|nr:N-acetyl-D-Glu racemase DgcA [Woeseiaceae bacterium]